MHGIFNICILSGVSDLAVVLVDVDPHNGLGKRWVGGGHNVIVNVLLVVQAIQALQVTYDIPWSGGVHFINPNHHHILQSAAQAGMGLL